MAAFYLIYLRNLRLDASIGIHAFEREQRQPLSLSVTLIMAGSGAPADDIASVVDYDYVREKAAQLVAEKHWELQESLCAALADALVTPDGVLGVIVKSAKTTVYADTDEVGCRLARLKPPLDPQFPWWTIDV